MRRRRKKKVETIIVNQEIDYARIENMLLNPLRILNENIRTTSSQLNGLMQQINAQQETIERLEENNRQQQKIIQGFQTDQLQKIKLPLIMDLIQLADGIRGLLEQNTQNDAATTSEVRMAGEVEKFESWIESILEENNVVRFEQEVPGEFDARTQKVVAHESTDDEKLIGKVVSVSPGYYWTLPYLIINSEVKLSKVATENKVPQKFTFVLRTEEEKHYNRK